MTMAQWMFHSDYAAHRFYLWGEVECFTAAVGNRDTGASKT